MFFIFQYKNKFSLSGTPSFAVEKLSQKEERHINNTRTGTGTVGILTTLLRESGKDPFGKYCHSDHKSLWGKEHVFMPQMGNLNTNTKDMPVTNVVPLDGKLISPCCLNSFDKYSLEANKTGTRNLESHDWSRVGVLANENSERLHVNSSRKRLNSNFTSSLSYSGHISEKLLGKIAFKDKLQKFLFLKTNHCLRQLCVIQPGKPRSPKRLFHFLEKDRGSQFLGKSICIWNGRSLVLAQTVKEHQKF